jgi:hypothetical protein
MIVAKHDMRVLSLIVKSVHKAIREREDTVQVPEDYAHDQNESNCRSATGQAIHLLPSHAAPRPFSLSLSLARPHTVIFIGVLVT